MDPATKRCSVGKQSHGALIEVCGIKIAEICNPSYDAWHRGPLGISISTVC
jgi:hypothetical protein